MEYSLLTIEILDKNIKLTQNTEESVEQFMYRLQEFFDKNNINIKVPCTTKHDKEFNKSYVYPAPDWGF